MFNKNQTYEQHDNEKISFYRSSIEDLNSQDQLTSDIDADICIIGGGLTGISSALNLSKKGYLKEAAKNLYKTLRMIRKKKFKSISVEKIPNKGIGEAINDRLTRASKF